MEVGVEEILNGLGDSEYRVEGVVDTAYCGAGGGSISVGPTSQSYGTLCGSSISGPERAKIVEDGGKDMPSTVSENGSLYPPGIPFIIRPSSRDDMDGFFVRESCLVVPTPMPGCFLNPFGLRASVVEAADPDASDGVRVLPKASGLGSRDDEVLRADLEAVNCGVAWVIGTLKVAVA
jgi:hypothetical protein